MLVTLPVPKNESLIEGHETRREQGSSSLLGPKIERRERVAKEGGDEVCIRSGNNEMKSSCRRMNLAL